MALSALPPTDTRSLFRPVSSALVALLRSLALDHWQAPTVAGKWVVRDLVAHLLDSTLRRLSFHRDRLPPPAPRRPIHSDRDLVEFINQLNAEWVSASARLSPRVLTDLFERASADLADWVEALPPDAPALFPVSWAGESRSSGWFDIGREFTELWHHQEQIRMAVGEPSLADPRYLHAVIDIAVRGLPHAYRECRPATGESVLLDVGGPAGGQWTLVREVEHWTLHGGAPAAPTTHVRLSDEAAWKLLFNALDDAEARRAVSLAGRGDLAAPLLTARSVIV